MVRERGGALEGLGNQQAGKTKVIPSKDHDSYDELLIRVRDSFLAVRNSRLMIMSVWGSLHFRLVVLIRYLLPTPILIKTIFPHMVTLHYIFSL